MMRPPLPSDFPFIRRCLELAERPAAAVTPNPLVGAMITLDNQVVAEGYHKACGLAHAEVNALEEWKAYLQIHQLGEEAAAAATLYISLEPCNHQGRTPPCTDAILESGIGTVVYACTDPHPLVQGRGLERLRTAGLQVRGPVLEKEARWMNRRFETMVHQNRPYTLLKWARTADGYLDQGENGPGPRISGPQAQRWVHRLRREQAALLVGARTLLLDNPILDARLAGPPHPRIAVAGDSRPWPLNLQVLQRNPQPLRLPWPTDGPSGSGPTKSPEGLKSWHKTLLDEGLNSVLVEGGAKTLEHFLQEGCWDEIHVIENPHMLTGKGTPAPAEPQSPLFSGNLGTDLYRVYLHPDWVPGQNAPDLDYLRDHFSPQLSPS